MLCRETFAAIPEKEICACASLCGGVAFLGSVADAGRGGALDGRAGLRGCAGAGEGARREVGREEGRGGAKEDSGAEGEVWEMEEEREREVCEGMEWEERAEWEEWEE